MMRFFFAAASVALLALPVAAQSFMLLPAPQPIPDGTGPAQCTNPGTPIIATALVSGVGCVSSLTVTLNLTHTWYGDVDVLLTAPDGTTMVSLMGRGNPCDPLGHDDDSNLGGAYVLDDTAATTFDAAATVAGASITPASYRPDNPLSGFNGILADGMWTLRIRDLVGFDTGTFNIGSSLNLVGAPLQTFYPDVDSDTYGDSSATASTGCTVPPGSVTDNTDCDDSNGAVNPGATEVCNGIDDNCDGNIDEAGSAVSQMYGASCPTLGMMLNSNPPVLGGSVTLTLTGAPANSLGIIAFSLGANPPTGGPYPPLGSCDLYLDQGGVFILGFFPTGAGGGFSVTGPVANDPFLQCLEVRLQVVVATVTGFEVSNGLKVIFGT